MQATSNYLNQWWPSSLTHICGTRGRWVNTIATKADLANHCAFKCPGTLGPSGKIQCTRLLQRFLLIKYIKNIFTEHPSRHPNILRGFKFLYKNSGCINYDIRQWCCHLNDGRRNYMHRLPVVLIYLFNPSSQPDPTLRLPCLQMYHHPTVLDHPQEPCRLQLRYGLHNVPPVNNDFTIQWHNDIIKWPRRSREISRHKCWWR